MKKKLLLLVALMICSTFVVSGTIAYYTDQDTAHNQTDQDGDDGGQDGPGTIFFHEFLHACSPSFVIRLAPAI